MNHPRCLFLLLPALVFTGCDRHHVDPPTAAMISTHATSHRRLENTVADITVGIETQNTSVANVTKTLADRSGKLIAFFKSQGAERLSTDQIVIEPQTHYARGGPDRIVGFSGSMKVSFRIKSESASNLISGALDQGANTVDNVSFVPREEDIDNARRDLAAEATRAAVTQAESVARAANEHVVGVLDIIVDPNGVTMDERVDEASASTMARAPMKSERPRPAIATAAGDNQLSITVDVRVAIAK